MAHGIKSDLTITGRRLSYMSYVTYSGTLVAFLSTFLVLSYVFVPRQFISYLFVLIAY